MEALQTVFEYIYGVLEIIKEFFAKLFPQDDNAEEDTGVTEG